MGRTAHPEPREPGLQLGRSPFHPQRSMRMKSLSPALLTLALMLTGCNVDTATLSNILTTVASDLKKTSTTGTTATTGLTSGTTATTDPATQDPSAPDQTAG